MKLPLMKYLFLSLILLVQIHGHKGCFEEERMALLEFKAFVKSDGYDADHLLPSWVDDPESKCCEWERVTCNSTTDHVIELDLSNTRQQELGSIRLIRSPDIEPVWFLNMSLFHPLKELRSLNLSFNLFSGRTDAAGFESLSRLKKLETLDLTNNLFNMSVIPSLTALTSLKTLILAHNTLDGSFPAQELSALENIETLDLSKSFLIGAPAMQELSNLSNQKVLKLQDNSLSETFPIQGLMTFGKLEILDLSLNSFGGSIPANIGVLSSLKALSVSQNMMNGSLPIESLCGLKRLEELDLSQNRFEGILPPCLNNLTSLRLLDLSMNKFTGNISSLVAGLTSLVYIDLSHNHFEGLFSFSAFGNHSKLEVFKFISDDYKFEIDIEHPGWVPLFQLKILMLQNCSLNKLNNSIPKFLFHQYDLRAVDLSHNKLKEKFPNWLLENNTRLEFLCLRNNSFYNQFHLPPYSMNSTNSFDISDNNINGQLQEDIGRILPNLKVLNLSRNNFEGGLPSSIGDIKNFEAMDLSFNNFSGEVPKELGHTKLKILILSNNKFHGQIFSTLFNLSFLKVLQLADNHFTGSLSNVKLRFFSLYVFDISSNYMSGKIPSSIANMTDLAILIMRDNVLEGRIPCEAFVNYVDLSHNLFTGSLPSCLHLSYIEHIHLQGNKLTGTIPKAFLDLSDLVALNLKDNNLTGSIPDNISAAFRLRFLLLSGNHLSGLIPKQLCQLRYLNLMDLSSNSFSGSIPLCFHNISFGRLVSSRDVAQSSFKYDNTNFLPYRFGPMLQKDLEYVNIADEAIAHVQVDFVTKDRLSSYKGDIVNFVSGLDLSCNNLTGAIPRELGNLSGIRAMNMSHNQLTGTIPRTFSNLSQLESLDLSHNNLSGEIPSELIDLNFLEVFSVAHNNLSGKVPDRKGQFGTFENSSYEENPFLCGLPLTRSCTHGDESPPKPADHRDGKWCEIDPVVFSASFSVSFVIFFLAVITVLYINPYWRQRLFYYSEEFMYSCYYFFSDTLHKLIARLYH